MPLLKVGDIQSQEQDDIISTGSLTGKVEVHIKVEFPGPCVGGLTGAVVVQSLSHPPTPALVPTLPAGSWVPGMGTEPVGESTSSTTNVSPLPFPHLTLKVSPF